MSEKNKTIEQYQVLYEIYDHFNQKFFDKKNRLGDCMIIINRKTKEPGHFKPNVWGPKKNIPEISLNPDLLGGSALNWCLELAHNMIHYWQFNKGNASRKGYHNTEFSEESDRVGMGILSANGIKFKQTGQIVIFAAKPNGILIKEYNYLEKTKNISSRLIFMFIEEKISKSSVKPLNYTCTCNNGFKGKAGIEFICKECGCDVLPKGSGKTASKYKITKL